MFNNLRKSIAAFINPVHTTFVPAGQKALTYGNAPAHILSNYERKEVAPVYAGHLSCNDLEIFTSEYLRDQVALGAAWSALAKAFSEYQKVTGVRKAEDRNLTKYLNEFHAWNAMVSANKQMEDEAVLVAVSKMCQPRLNKSNDQADAIIARVRKVSVQELKDQRIKEASKEAAKKEAALEGFCALAWSSVDHGDFNPSITGAFAVAKILSTIDFVGRTWTGDGASIAGELLLMEDDLAKVEAIAAKERDDTGDFVDGVLTADGMMRLNGTR